MEIDDVHTTPNDSSFSDLHSILGSEIFQPEPANPIPAPPPLPPQPIVSRGKLRILQRKTSSSSDPSAPPAPSEASEPEETLLCPICYDSVPKSQCTTLACCDSAYCIACLQRFVFEFIQAGKVNDVCCPNPDCSSQAWGREEVAGVLEKHAAEFEMGDRTLNKEEVVCRFVRFKMLSDAQADQVELKKTYVCRNDKCDGVLVPSDKEHAGDSIMCRLCATSHCGTCFLVHTEDESCDRARKRTKKEDYKKTDKYQRRKEWTIAARAFLPTVATRISLAVKPNVKRCPTCRKFIEKYYGCKHMYCSGCQTSFCWICCTPRGRGSHCKLAKAIWPASLVAAIVFSAVYVPVMFLPWLAAYGIERGILHTNPRDCKSRVVWDQFYFVNEMLAAFPY
jgi:hypothetical protein